MKHSIVKMVGAAALVAPLLSGCYVGKNSATNTQGNSGNGTSLALPGIKIDNATVVAGDPDSGKAAFLGTVYNSGETEDALVSISADGGPGKLLPNPVKLPPGEAVTITTGAKAMADFTGLKSKPGTYTPIVLTFKNAGKAEFPSLVVPPAGYYFPASPKGTKEVVDVEVNEVSVDHEEIPVEVAENESTSGGTTPASESSATTAPAGEGGATQ